MPVEEQFVQTSFGKIYVKTIGHSSAAEVLVLLHDAIGSVSIWGSFPQKLHELTGRRVVVFDRLGYGKSSDDPKVRGVDYMMHEATIRLPELLSKLQITEPILVGHSDGGTIALEYASAFRTKALISMAAHIYVEEITRKGIQSFFDQKDFEPIKSKLQRHHDVKNEHVLNAWRDTWLSHAYKSWNIESELKKVVCPCLLIQGKQDEYATDQHAMDIQNGIGSNARLHFLDECGHVPYKEQTEKVLDLVTAFLTQI